MSYQKVDASCWYRWYQLIPLSHSQLYNLIPAQPLNPSHFCVIRHGCYTWCLILVASLQL